MRWTLLMRAFLVLPGLLRRFHLLKEPGEVAVAAALRGWACLDPGGWEGGLWLCSFNADFFPKAKKTCL